MAEVGKAFSSILPDTLRKAIGQAICINRVKKDLVRSTPVSSKSERTQIDSEAEMGTPGPPVRWNGWRPRWKRRRGAGAIRSRTGCAAGGVLLALPALLATGLLRFTEQFYALPKGFSRASTAFLSPCSRPPWPALPPWNSCVMCAGRVGQLAGVWTVFRKYEPCAAS